ncbi:hypothetical protein HN031_14835 [Nocardioides sp. zg-1308]|uniref:hypothetical protein n=1 Tax=Nocardioides sp. zg-1308 TaxID=2736253 RepID=UPI001557F47F|nr:hypothetical protein [Nocardioides sp. zg-1308]NPD05960.1 hypothetical protein [Nocardioides sp. zg-1308]
MTSTTTLITGAARALVLTLALPLALAALVLGLAGSPAGATSLADGPTSSLRSDDDRSDDRSDDDSGDDDSDGDDDNGGGDDDRVIRTGSCAGGADWKLKVKTDDGRLEVEGEVDSNVAGQRWRWTLRHNGSVSDRGVGTTTARSGSFEVERKIVDLAGTDAVAFRAVRDGQVCRGVVNY